MQVLSFGVLCHPAGEGRLGWCCPGEPSHWSLIAARGHVTPLGVEEEKTRLNLVGDVL